MRGSRSHRAAALGVSLLVTGCNGGAGDFAGFEAVEEKWGFGQVEARGVCIFDADGDLDNDVLLVRAGVNLYFENVAPEQFEERGAEVGLATESNGLGCGVGDLDRDGSPEIIVTDHDGPTRVFSADADGVFFDRADALGLTDNSDQSSVVLEDVDRDGWTDLLLTGIHHGHSRLWRNIGDGTFEDRTSALPVTDVQRSWGAAFFDGDGDGLPDLYFGTDVPAMPEFVAQNDYLLRNLGDFEFEDITEESAFPNLRNAMGIAVADVDQDGFLDFYVTNIGHHALYWNLGDGTFADVSVAVGVANSGGAAGWGALFADPDDDGLEELFVVNGGLYGDVDTIEELVPAPRERNRYFSPVPTGFDDGMPEFEDLAVPVGLDDGGSGMGAAWGDLDGDGRVDLVLANRGSSLTRVYRNLGNDLGGAPATRVLLRGADSNPEALGARLRLEACGQVLLRHRGTGPSVISQGEEAVHFGTRKCEEERELTVVWPSGLTTEHLLPVPERGDPPIVLHEDD